MPWKGNVSLSPLTPDITLSAIVVSGPKPRVIGKEFLRSGGQCHDGKLKTIYNYIPHICDTHDVCVMPSPWDGR